MSAAHDTTMPGGLRRARRADAAAVTAHQRAAYEPNRIIMGADPLPLRADYHDVLKQHEGWLLERDGKLAGVLIVHPRDDDLYVWNISVAPGAQGGGIGNTLLAAAHARAAAHKRSVLRLRTAEKMQRNVDWYRRHGFAIERTETEADRVVVHMVKHLTAN